MACGCCRCRCRHIKHFPAICCPPQRRCQLVAIRSQLAPCPALGRTLIIVIEFAKLRLKCFRPSLATWHPFIVWLFVCLFACLFASPPPPPLTVPFGNFTRCSSRFWTRFRFLIRFWFRFRFRVWACAWAWAWVYLPVRRSLFAVYLIVCLFGGPTLINCRFYWHFGFDVVVYWVRKKFIAYFCAHAPRNCLPSTGQRAHKGIVCSVCHYPLSWLAGSFRLFASFNCLLCGNCLPCGQLMNLIRHARIIIVPAHD